MNGFYGTHDYSECLMNEKKKNEEKRKENDKCSKIGKLEREKQEMRRTENEPMRAGEEMNGVKGEFR